MDERDAMLLLTNGRCPASVTSVCGSFFSSACEATWVVKAIRNDGLGPRVPANPCFQRVISLFSLCYLVLQKSSKSLIPLVIARSIASLFFLEISLFPEKIDSAAS